MKESSSSNWQNCNVVDFRPSMEPTLWHFVRTGKGLSNPTIRPLSPEKKDHLSWVEKGWGQIWKKRLNVGWLPLKGVYLKAIQIPPCESHAEQVDMVELQLEKLSPLPVSQIVWGIESLPGTDSSGLNTLIVVIVERRELEAVIQSYEAQQLWMDRMELPALRELLAHSSESKNGAWLYPNINHQSGLCLAAWWSQNELKHLALLRFPPSEDGLQELRRQIEQILWAGEIEGWHQAPVRWNVVVNPEDTTPWQTLFPDEAIHLLPPLSRDHLAEESGKAHLPWSAHQPVNLLPLENLTRYRQSFIDRLWMRGLGVAFLLYILGLIIFFASLEYAKHQKVKIERETASLEAEFKKALQLKERVNVLQEQLNLRFAALDCWHSTSTLLPAGLTLTDLRFQRGQTLSLDGTAPVEQQSQVLDFSEQMRKNQINATPLFSSVETPSSRLNNVRGQGQRVNWSFKCELNKGK